MSWPNPPRIRTGGFPLDKAIHFLLYAVEAFLLDRAIGWKGRPGFAWSRALAIVGTMTLWGAAKARRCPLDRYLLKIPWPALTLPPPPSAIRILWFSSLIRSFS